MEHTYRSRACVGFELIAGWYLWPPWEDPVHLLTAISGRIKLILWKETDKVIGPEPPMNPADMKFDEKGRLVISDEMKKANELLKWH